MPDLPPPRAANPLTCSTGDGMAFDFLAFHGGPFFDLQKSLSLIHERAFHTRRRVILFVSLTWGAPLLLTLPGGESGGYLLDPGPGTRFLLAITAFIMAEQSIETRLRRKLRQFIKAPLIAPAAMAEGVATLDRALRQRDSCTAEIACLTLAAASGILAYATIAASPFPNWASTTGPDGRSLTLAGWWCVCISIPIFSFLLLRGIWRHLVWANLLRGIARLELRLVSTHPDGKAGLAFVGDYPNAYVLYVFGVSCAVAAAVGKHITQTGGLSATTLTTLMACWLLLVLAFFAYPLSAFSRPLSDLKERSLRMLSAQATVQQRSTERKALGTNIAAPGTDEQQVSELADVSKQFEQTRKLSTLLLNRNALLPVATAALVPFAVAGASQLPFKEVLSVLKKLLLI